MISYYHLTAPSFSPEIKYFCIAKKKALAKKYDNELKTKRETIAKAYKAKLEAADKNITNTIIQQAKAQGYDLVLTKGVVLYGGDDITESILKVIK